VQLAVGKTERFGNWQAKQQLAIRSLQSANQEELAIGNEQKQSNAYHLIQV
jgi:hypothetical protein